ncbi:MAG: PD40 domain-containing protein [Anaerolineae bacterium]|nr:PD40 domain-containing protein [Anaerolineae bacterium]
MDEGQNPPAGRLRRALSRLQARLGRRAQPAAERAEAPGAPPADATSPEPTVQPESPGPPAQPEEIVAPEPPTVLEQALPPGNGELPEPPTRPQRPARPLVLSRRAVWAFALLVVANLVVLALLSIALYQSGLALQTRPPFLTVVVTPTPLPTATPLPTPTPYGSVGAVAFTLRQNGNADIYAINQTTHEVVRLTSDQAEDRDPAWSPDGEMLAFASNRGNNWDVYLLDLEGGALIRLTRDSHFDGGPTWSPDGERIAFEAYRNGNLDIHTMDATGRDVRRLTTDPAPDYSPAWSPDGQMIAYTSFRQGNQDVFLYVLEGEEAGKEFNVTQSPNSDESDPVWSPDSSQLAYTIGRAGYSTVQVSNLEWRTTAGITETETVLRLTSFDLFGSGCSPTWAPDGAGLVTVYQRGQRSYLIASSLYGWGLSQEVYSAEALLGDPAWSPISLSPGAIVRARAAAPAFERPLYTEFVQPTSVGEGVYTYTLVYLPDVNGGDDRALLSERVDDSFAALRQRVLEETGWDYFAIVGSAWRPMDHTPRPGQSSMSWHVCGRAIDVNQGFYDQDDQIVHLIREDVGNETYWRVMIEATEQDGSMGEPLRVAPWDLKAREEGGTAAVQGGQLLAQVPPGYFVDFTALAADYGWERVSALYRWRYYWPDIEWWHHQKTDGLNWWQCMLELYAPDKIEEVFGPLPEDVLETDS